MKRVHCRSLQDVDAMARARAKVRVGVRVRVRVRRTAHLRCDHGEPVHDIHACEDANHIEADLHLVRLGLRLGLGLWVV